METTRTKSQEIRELRGGLGFSLDRSPQGVDPPGDHIRYGERLHNLGTNEVISAPG